MHLNMLESYFELLGIDKIDDLPAGASTDSYQDPQIFLGGLEVATTAPQGLNSMPIPDQLHLATFSATPTTGINTHFHSRF
jgi:hypothetical protein